ncbi:hypothetical protein COEREDRAFT_10491 [Coemansia reversa NRRL 1564]|uniref:Uncharacterized protein n=1 Tax=Coemansia reversa (strain ATCC 12441 / NRRL 1564) TaxID=763665 RepID=A0A2G5B5L9_COERN|nr:hypothetical protein COEREDRAFT_10491 [Coemansia reversa NRRL 1564]|eukprot:PIA14294.1 hypothetical protein COEREDRAFT_10491 [Coemansia reversa NRRL 1564]
MAAQQKQSRYASPSRLAPSYGAVSKRCECVRASGRSLSKKASWFCISRAYCLSLPAIYVHRKMIGSEAYVLGMAVQDAEGFSIRRCVGLAIVTLAGDACPTELTPDSAPANKVGGTAERMGAAGIRLASNGQRSAWRGLESHGGPPPHSGPPQCVQRIRFCQRAQAKVSMSTSSSYSNLPTLQPQQQQPPRRKSRNRSHSKHNTRTRTRTRTQSRRPSVAALLPVVDSLPTPPDDVLVHGGMHAGMLGSAGDMPCTPSEDISVTSPSGAYPLMTLAEKVREANYALIHQWGRFLVGAAVSELYEVAIPGLHQPRTISVIDLPSNFCISPADELLCPSTDPTRVIVIVSAAGVILDTGIFDLDGPLFYQGLVVNHHYVPRPTSR